MCDRNDRMSLTAGTGDIQCPFFNAHNRTAIRCKDIIPGTEHITTTFESQEEKKFHQETYCESHYKKCWLYTWAMQMQWDD